MHTIAQYLRDTLDQVLPLLLAISNEEAERRPAPGKWSKKEIIGHLVDSACNNQQKFVRTMIAPSGHLDFVGYAQNEWVATQHYQRVEWPTLVSFWEQYNRHIAHIIAVAAPNALSNTISIEGKGPFRLDFIMADYVEHLKHHLMAVLPEAKLTSAFKNIY